MAWMPAVGIVERLFPLPEPVSPGLILDSLDSLAPRAFVDLIAR
jgi:hypothetical protein